MNPLILSVDLDEWFHCRWATGSKTARWPTVRECLQEYYQSDRPAGEIILPTLKILKMLKNEQTKATFFVLGEVARWYPRLVKEISRQGHEIACHGLRHYDLTLTTKNKCRQELRATRVYLRRLTGQRILGFRAPNLVVPSWLTQVLIDEGFLYDSSVCPSRKLQGKFLGQASASSNPYRIGDTVLEKGAINFWEIPIPTFPLLKLPGAVSIATRLFGCTWTKITLDTALSKGATCYYFHPYELNPPPKPPIRLKEKIFLWRTGSYLEEILKDILKTYRGRVVSIRDYLEKYERIKIR